MLNIKALDFSIKASVIQKLYLNPNWFSSKLIGMSHPTVEVGSLHTLRLESLKLIFQTLSANVL